MAEERESYRTKRKNKAGENDDKNALEWTVFAVSLLLVLSIVGYLVYEVYRHEPSTPDLVVAHYPDPAAHAPNRYRVVVRNQGGESAEEVVVELSLEQGGEEIEKAELSIAFSPKESKREGWVNFKEDPKLADTLVARVVSYKRP